jgi:hypothetical protein
MNENFDINEKLGDMLNKAIDIDLDNLQNGKIIQPWLMTLAENSTDYTMTIVSDLTGNAGVDEARKKVKDKANSIEAYIIGFDGTVSIEGGQKVKGLFYELSEKHLCQDIVIW